MKSNLNAGSRGAAVHDIAHDIACHSNGRETGYPVVPGLHCALAAIPFNHPEDR
jgi:hypothetical protein